jgi:hypothetical protein
MQFTTHALHPLGDLLETLHVDILRNIKGGSCKSGTLAIAGHPERVKTNKYMTSDIYDVSFHCSI